MRHAFFVLLLLASFHSSAQTIYGITGLVRVPTAYIADNGSGVIGVSHYSHYTDRGALRDHLSFSFTLGLTSRMEGTARLVGFPGVSGGDNDIYGIPFDRMVSGKVVLSMEQDRWPQVSFGIQDAVGTLRAHAIYVVAGKGFSLVGPLRAYAHAGYSSPASRIHPGEVLGFAYPGFFGAIEAAYGEYVSLSAEYEGSRFHLGLSLSPFSWLHFQGFLLECKRPGAGISANIML